MKPRTQSDFAHYYATSLLRELKELEEVRKSVLAKVNILIAITAGLFMLSVAMDRTFGLNWMLIAIASVVCTAAGSFFYRFLTGGYVHQFKLKVISKIIEFIDPGLTYWADGHITQMQFHSSRIFEKYPDRLRGDDLVKGRIGRTNVEFSEVRAEYKTETTDSSGRRQRRYHTIFKGLFFIADFNKKFYGKTVVLPDTAERLLGGIGGFLQSLNRSRGEMIKLENPEFERYFVVYGDNQIESRYVLSTSLAQRILDFRKKTGKRVYLSFVGSEVFVAIPYRRGLFEPRVFTSITGFRSVREYFEDLQLALGIVNDLNLNTRIWATQQVV
jgi:hypothetical protein